MSLPSAVKRARRFLLPNLLPGMISRDSAMAPELNLPDVSPLAHDRTASRIKKLAVPFSTFLLKSAQQYLAKNPFGYRCHANTGVKFPA